MKAVSDMRQYSYAITSAPLLFTESRLNLCRRDSVDADGILQSQPLGEALLHACRIGKIKNSSKFRCSNFTEITVA
jgi:hypothetical protein